MDLIAPSRRPRRRGLRKAPESVAGWSAKRNLPPVSLDQLGLDPSSWELFTLSPLVESQWLDAGPEALLLRMEQLDPLDMLALWADMNG